MRYNATQAKRMTRACIDAAGGVPEVARALGLRDWAVRRWYHRGILPVSDRYGNRAGEVCALANKRQAALRGTTVDAMPEEELYTVGKVRPDITTGGF